MAIRVIQKGNLKVVEVICKNDDALDLDNSEWDEYVKTGDVTHLKFLEDKQPTRFICNFELSGKESALLKNEMLGGTDEEGKPKIAIGSFQYRVAKYTLKDIQNPSDIPVAEQLVLKKDDRAYVNDYTMSLLERCGVVDSIFTLYSNLVLDQSRQNAKN